MLRKRIMLLATAAAIGLVGALAPTAVAGTHWSNDRCDKEYETWGKHNAHKKMSEKQRTKAAEAYFKKIDKHHGCDLGFGRGAAVGR